MSGKSLLCFLEQSLCLVVNLLLACQDKVASTNPFHPTKLGRALHIPGFGPCQPGGMVFFKAFNLSSVTL